MIRRTIYFIIAILFLASVTFAQSPVGGYLYSVKNTSGGTIYRGQVLCGDSTSAIVINPYAVVLCPSNALYPIGTVYNDSIVNNGIGFMTAVGAGYVAVTNSKTRSVKPENRVLTTSSGTAGLADCEVTDSVVDHFREIGQPLTIMIGKNANGDSICIADIHKN